MKKLFLVLASIIAIGATQVQAQAATLNLIPGADPNAQIWGTVTYQNFTNTSEVTDALVNGTTTDSTNQINWNIGAQSTNPFSITYNKNAQTLTTTVGEQTITSNVNTENNENYLSFFLLKGTGAVNINDLKLNNESFNPDSLSLADSHMSGSWYLRTDLSQGFTLTGNIFL